MTKAKKKQRLPLKLIPFLKPYFNPVILTLLCGVDFCYAALCTILISFIDSASEQKTIKTKFIARRVKTATQHSFQTMSFTAIKVNRWQKNMFWIYKPTTIIAGQFHSILWFRILFLYCMFIFWIINVNVAVTKLNQPLRDKSSIKKLNRKLYTTLCIAFKYGII